MPLVVPAINSGRDSKEATWMNKLMGKKLGDTTGSTSFARQDLPKEHRVIEAGSMATQDFNKDRMNVHLAEDGTVRHVDFK